VESGCEKLARAVIGRAYFEVQPCTSTSDGTFATLTVNPSPRSVGCYGPYAPRFGCRGGPTRSSLDDHAFAVGGSSAILNAGGLLGNKTRSRTRMSRDDFSREVIDTLARRVNHRCSMPNCRQDTSGPRSDPNKSVCIGVASHITAAARGGPRYDPSLTSEQRSSAENGIWLCQNHAKLVDNDPAHFTADLLLDWKRTAESAARASLQRGAGVPDSTTALSGVVSPGSETLEDLAVRAATAERLESARRRFRHSEEGVRALAAEFRLLREATSAQVGSLQNIITLETIPHDDTRFSVRAPRVTISFQLERGRFGNSLDGWRLMIFAWRGASPFMGALSRQPERLGQRNLILDLQLDGVRWAEATNKDYTGPALAESALKWLITLDSTQNRSR
jgi:hypothetical protein